jgi:hypothetical protein
MYLFWPHLPPSLPLPPPPLPNTLASLLAAVQISPRGGTLVCPDSRFVPTSSRYLVVLETEYYLFAYLVPTVTVINSEVTDVMYLTLEVN